MPAIRRLDAETGLYYYRNRYYHPEIGRFMSAHPIGYGSGMNMYAYVGNDPMNYVDPWGLSADCTVTQRGRETILTCPRPPNNDNIDGLSTNFTIVRGGDLSVLSGGGGFSFMGFTGGGGGGASNDEEDENEDANQKIIEEIIVNARRSRRFSNGVLMTFDNFTDFEQGFLVSLLGIFEREITRQGTRRCDDGSVSRAGTLNIAGLGLGQFLGHTHPRGTRGFPLSGLPGREDGRIAAATGRTAYVISTRGAFAIDPDFSIRLLAGARLSRNERKTIRELQRLWRENNGASGAKCTFTPD